MKLKNLLMLIGLLIMFGCGRNVPIRDMSDYSDIVYDSKNDQKESKFYNINDRYGVSFESLIYEDSIIDEVIEVKIVESNNIITYVVGTWKDNRDCLWNIALKYYDNGSDWKLIYNSNSHQIDNPNIIYPGQELIIER